MRLALAWILLCSAALAQQPFPGVPPGWSLYVVHARWCAPCQRFRRDYDTIDVFRNKLESGFAVKSVEWDKPSEQRFAKRFAIASLPGFIVFRNGIHQQSFSGYDGNWQAFLQRLNLDDGGAGQVPGGGTEGSARPVTPTEQALPEITDLRLQIDKLREQLREQSRKQTADGVVPPAAPVAIDATRQVDTPSPPPLPTLAIPAAGHSVGSSVGAAGGGQQSEMPDIGGKWWSVLTTVGKIGLTTLAPEVALPASAALTAAGYVFGQVKKRRSQAAQAEFFRANRTPARDVTEVEQVLSLRQQECRDPLSDAMFGVLFEDLAREDANQTVGQAWTAAQQRFNRLAPLSSKSATITSSTKEN